MEERSLGENRPDTEQPGEVRDITLDEWIEGVRAFRLPVDVTLVTGDPTGEKTQRLLDLADEIDALPDGPEVDALIEEAEALQSSITTTMRFVLEQLSRRSENCATRCIRPCTASSPRALREELDGVRPRRRCDATRPAFASEWERGLGCPPPLTSLPIGSNYS